MVVSGKFADYDERWQMRWDEIIWYGASLEAGRKESGNGDADSKTSTPG